MPRKQGSRLLVVAIAAISILAFSGLVLSFLTLFQTDVNRVHKTILGFPVPEGANHVEYDAPSFLTQWKDDYTIISYNLRRIDLAALLPHGFSNWEPLNEIYVGHRLFTYAQMPHAWISSRKSGKIYSAIIVDLDHNQVFVVSCYG